MKKTAKHFVLHRNTIRAWIRAAEGKGRPSLLNGAVVWNRIDEAVRWAIHEFRRLCPEPESGTRSIARQMLLASIQISRTIVQRVLREPEPTRPHRPAKPAMALPLGKKPYHLLAPKWINRVACRLAVPADSLAAFQRGHDPGWLLATDAVPSRLPGYASGT